MHIHILGICGTFMGSLALIARSAGHTVSGSDQNIYPPMSTQLQAEGIELMNGYDAAHLQPRPDLVVVGNVMSRGNPMIEYMLAERMPYTSGPQWLSEHILQDRWVLAVAGTHGKTTTSSMLAWILEDAGLSPGYLIGGVPNNFGLSARLGEAPFFVIEADEYDTAFFDKRSKFVHYRPQTLVMNNLEFDHADIFPDLNAIQTQFHHLLRIVPPNGLVVCNQNDSALAEVIKRGIWTPVEGFGQGEKADWQSKLKQEDGSCFEVLYQGQALGTIKWSMTGAHNVANALAAIAAARHAGVIADAAVDALNRFTGVRRRMELRGEVAGVKVYDDFAHHPTAIETTLQGLRKQPATGRILALLEPRSNTMRMGVHGDRLAQSLDLADKVMLYQPPGLDWNLDQVATTLGDRANVYHTIESIVDSVTADVVEGDAVLVMSNGAFGAIHEKLLDALQSRNNE